MLLSSKGIYVGVTATPARLDLNNTFDNDSSQWITFPPHPAYTGQDTFFPLNKKIDNYRLQLIPDHGAGPEHARRALFGFLVNVAYLNRYVNDWEQNYSFLIHTSGKKVDHKADREHIYKCLKELVERESESFKRYTEGHLAACTRALSPGRPKSPDRIHPRQHRSPKGSGFVNSERDWKDNSAAATNPSTLFTIIIGGNIVSRGVTFDNLLSMFFTRDVKHKIQQDTYIQRARMFGSRGDYLKYFELTIPKSLYDDWHRCFVFHRLALSAITEGLGSLVWLGDKRIAAVASSSIDRSTVDLNRGEMSFSIFDWRNQLDDIVAGTDSIYTKISKIVDAIGEKAFPIYVRRYIKAASPSDALIAVHPSSLITGGDYDVENIARRKGLMGKSQLEPDKYPKAIHHIKIFRNSQGKARLFYKLSGSIQMIRNTTNDT